MATVRKKNVSGEDLEVAVLDNRVVKAGETVEVPTQYPWGDEIGWPEAIWEDAKADSKGASDKATSKPETE